MILKPILIKYKDRVINNVEFIAWKEKLILKRQQEEATFSNLDDFTEPFEFKAPAKPIAPPIINESNNIGQMPSLSFQMPQAQPKVSNHVFLNQSLPATNPPPGFGNFEPQNNMKSFDGGLIPSVINNNPMQMNMPQAQMMNTFQMHPEGLIHTYKSTGRLKFFDEVQNYGFLIVDGDESDLFVHYDDLKDAKLSRDILRQAKTNYFLQFSFDIAYYSGKYKESKKAINLKLLKIEKLGIVN